MSQEVLGMEIGERIKKKREELGMSQDELAKKVGYTSRSSVAKVETNANGMVQSKLIAFAKALETTPAYLMGWEDELPSDTELPVPNATSDFVTFPVMGEIAAGYDSLALEDWNGETVDIPTSYFKGRDKSEFFVLEVKGDSMYPEYQDGDRVLILKQSTLEYSGQVGAILYEDTNSTLKKVEYREGEDWLRLVPINPNFKPQRIEGEALEHCKVIGIPRLLIRNIQN